MWMDYSGDGGGVAAVVAALGQRRRWRARAAAAALGLEVAEISAASPAPAVALPGGVLLLSPRATEVEAWAGVLAAAGVPGDVLAGARVLATLFFSADESPESSVAARG